MSNNNFLESYRRYQEVMLSMMQDGLHAKGVENIKYYFRSSYTKDLANLNLEFKVKNIAQIFNFHNSWLEFLFHDRDKFPRSIDLNILDPKYAIKKMNNVLVTRLETIEAEKLVRTKTNSNEQNFCKGKIKILDKNSLPEMEVENTYITKSKVPHKKTIGTSDFTDYLNMAPSPVIFKINTPDCKLNFRSLIGACKGWNRNLDNLVAVCLNKYDYEIDMYSFGIAIGSRTMAGNGTVLFDDLISNGREEIHKDKVYITIPIKNLHLTEQDFHFKNQIEEI